jgi:hypothetical protein
VLLASGYIAGGSLAGVAAAFLEFAPGFKKQIDFSASVAAFDQDKIANLFTMADIVSMLLFAGLIVFAILVGTGRVLRPPAEETNPSPSPSDGD